MVVRAWFQGLREGPRGRSVPWFKGCWIGAHHAGRLHGCCVAAFVVRDEQRVGFTLACADT